MTIHLENHPYAIFRNGKVVNIVTMQEHDDVLAQHLTRENAADSFLSCCEYGEAWINGDMLHNKFRPPKPHQSWVWSNSEWEWVAPLPRPQDTVDIVHVWDEELGRWQAVELNNPLVTPKA